MQEREIQKLLDKMSIEEKIGQLVQIKENIFEEKNTIAVKINEKSKQERIANVGSILNTAGAEKVRTLQDNYLSNHRLKIPLLFMGDIINGYKIAFPIPLAQGCSWDVEVIRQCAKISMEEAKVAGIMVQYFPMLDLVRDARWGRVMEAIGGEDSFLAGIYAKAIIQTHHNGNMITCVKHFVGYGAVEAGREYNTVDISQRELRQYYFPAYKIAIESGVEMLMTSFNTINGIPVVANKWLLDTILRKEWGFKGTIISDYGAIEELVAHGIAENTKEATYKAFNAGIDIDMMSTAYSTNLKELIKEGRISEYQLDEKVLRLLHRKNQLGLFENPYGNANLQGESKEILKKENLEKAKELTTKTIVLLKNKDILPLSKNKKIALIGPYADNPNIEGSWSIFCNNNSNKTLRQALEEKIGKENLLYAKGSEILPKEELNAILRADGKPEIIQEDEIQRQKEKLEQAIKIAKKADIIILALGEHDKQSGEGASRATIELPNIQRKLLEELTILKIPIVVVLFNGRPLVLKPIAEKVEALLEAWFPGTMGAEAIADILYGKTNPSGKLTMSFPQAVGQCPIYYNHYHTGRPNDREYRFQSRYQDIPTKSYYPFGFGLSYSKFSYTKLKLDKKQITPNSIIKASVIVENISDTEGEEVIQWYIQDEVASVVRPVKELKGFRKAYFMAHERKIIEFIITLDMLKFWNEKMEYVVEPGEFKIYVGRNSEETLEAEFRYK